MGAAPASRTPHAKRPVGHPSKLREMLVEPGEEAGGALAVGLVFVAELGEEEGFFGADARDEKWDEGDDEKHAHAGTKGEDPAEGVEEQAEVAGMTNDTVDSGGDESVVALDGDESAEAVAENEDGPEADCAAEEIEGDADPAGGVSVDGPEVEAVGVGGNESEQKTDDGKSEDDPTIAAIFANTGADVASGEIGEDDEEGGGAG